MQSVFALQSVLYPIWSRTFSEFAYDGSDAGTREKVQNSSTPETWSTTFVRKNEIHRRSKERKKTSVRKMCSKDAIVSSESLWNRSARFQSRKKKARRMNERRVAPPFCVLQEIVRELVKSPCSPQHSPMPHAAVRKAQTCFRSIFVLDSHYTCFNWNDAQHTFCISRYANSVQLCSLADNCMPFGRCLSAISNAMWALQWCEWNDRTSDCKTAYAWSAQSTNKNSQTETKEKIMFFSRD